MKRIPKKLASREDFQREMEALLRIQKWGGESAGSVLDIGLLVLNHSIHENARTQVIRISVPCMNISTREVRRSTGAKTIIHPAHKFLP